MLWNKQDEEGGWLFAFEQFVIVVINSFNLLGRYVISYDLLIVFSQ